MRKTVMREILQILKTLQEAHGEILDFLCRKEYENVRGLLADCQDCAVLIGDTIEQFEVDQTAIIAQLEEYCEYLFRVYEKLEEETEIDFGEIKNNLDVRIERIREAIKRDIRVELKVVFMPYKAAMWTSLASIWETAQADPECEAQVVVIPYYKLDEQKNPTELAYEADLFPKDVPITHYSQYNLTVEQPDMIFIHNPYDDRNILTRVPEQYYSYILKLCTGQLIYSPYAMLGYYDPANGHFLCRANAVAIADKILMQSERGKEIYSEHGVEEHRLLVLGSPKVDAVVKKLKMPPVYPEGWEERLKGRKVFLLNTHLTYFARGYDYAKANPGAIDFAKWHHEQIFDCLLNQERYALIWRPHPLLKSMLQNRGLSETLQFVENLEQRIKTSNNAVLDEFGDYDISFKLSDALVTTYSSLIPEYMISGKPIFVYQTRLDAEKCHNSPVDYTNLYYGAGEGKVYQFSEFAEMILKGEDVLYEQRMADLHRAFSNLEGTVGENIYRALKSEWQSFLTTD